MDNDKVISLLDYRRRKEASEEAEKKEIEKDVNDLLDNLSSMIKLYEQKLSAAID